MHPPPLSPTRSALEIPSDHLTGHGPSETVALGLYPWRAEVTLLPQATSLAILPSASASLTTMRRRPVSTAPAFKRRIGPDDNGTSAISDENAPKYVESGPRTAESVPERGLSAANPDACSEVAGILSRLRAPKTLD